MSRRRWEWWGQWAWVPACRRGLNFAFGLGLLWASPVVSFAVEAPWQVGLASIRITPELPVPMFGYGAGAVHQSVASHLYAKALAVRDSDGHMAVMVTCDLCGVHGDMTARIAERLGRKHGLPRASILFNASHTHAGPWPWIVDEKFADVEESVATATRAYVKKLEAMLEQVADEALAKLEPANLSWGLGVAPFVMNRRQFTDQGIVLGVNPKGPVDRSVLVLRIDDAHGKLRAMLMGVACHCTCAGPANREIDGDFAGAAQTALQAQFPGAQAMFIAGCGGDANPWPRGELVHARQHGATLAAEVARVLSGKLDPIRPPLRTAFQTVDLDVAPPAPRAKLEELTNANTGWQRYIGQRQLALLDQGQTPLTRFPMPVALWQFGGDFTLVGLGGEPVNDYVHLIEHAIGPMRVWVAGYCNDVFGYVPSARILREGGYETRGLDRGDVVGLFTPQAEQAILEAVESMARKTGRLK